MLFGYGVLRFHFGIVRILYLYIFVLIGCVSEGGWNLIGVFCHGEWSSSRAANCQMTSLIDGSVLVVLASSCLLAFAPFPFMAIALQGWDRWKLSLSASPAFWPHPISGAEKILVKLSPNIRI